MAPALNEDLAQQAELEAAYRTQFKTMLHSTWLFLPVAMINATLMGIVCFQVVSWWNALIVPTAIVVNCYSQLWDYSRLELDHMTASDRRMVVARQSRNAIATAVVIAGWGFWLGANGTREFSYFVALMGAFTAVSTVTYVAYLTHAVRAVLVAVGMSMLAMFAYRGDPAGGVLTLLYSTSTFMLQHHLKNHFEKLQGVVRSEIQAHGEIEDAKKAQAAFAEVANTDFLTGVANRRAFLSAVEVLVSDRAETRKPFALGVIDLDGFKPVNDCYGHATGDRVLIEVARRLRVSMLGQGLVARLGGDEFAMLIDHPPQSQYLKSIGDSLITKISAPIQIDDIVINISASCGFAQFPEAGTHAATLLERADDALYKIKGTTRSTTGIFDIASQLDTVRRATIEQRLRRAIETDAIELYYQPICCAQTGSIRSYEALARWTDEQFGGISPAEFIPIAERCGLINLMARKLLAKAAAEATNWPAAIGLSFNLSAVEFNDKALALNILSALSKAGLPPSRLTLEITETAILGNPEHVGEVLSELRSLGVKIALDDFGTGYSSLGYLHRIPVDQLKLDRSFIADLSHNEQRQAIVGAVIDLCKRLHLSCVAEGIEDRTQRDFVIAMGVDALQGYFLGRPQPPGLMVNTEADHRGKVA